MKKKIAYGVTGLFLGCFFLFPIYILNMNSLLITVMTAVLVLLISAMAAWVLVRYKTKASKIIFLIFAGSMLIPFQCVMLPLVGFASKIGLLSRGGLIFMYMGFQTSMAIIMFHGFIKNISDMIYSNIISPSSGTSRFP